MIQPLLSSLRFQFPESFFVSENNLSSKLEIFGKIRKEQGIIKTLFFLRI